MPSPLRILQRHVTIGDPHITSDDYSRLNILASVFEPLIKRDAGGLYRPCLAESWSLSQDACAWTFQLREGVVCHDGSLLGVADVASTLLRIRDDGVGGELSTQGVYQSYLAGSVISKVDPRTVQVVTREATADLLDLLVDIPILPTHAIEQLPEVMIGTGPYQLRQRSEAKLVLEVHAAHWRQEQRPHVLEWVGMADPEGRLESFLSGKADIATDLPSSATQRLATSSTTTVIAAQTTVCATFMLNLFEGVCTSKEVRQALNVALDKEALIREVVHGAAIALSGPMTSTHLGFNPATSGYPYDPKKARAQLEKEGIEQGLKISLDIPSILPDEAPALAQKMRAYYHDIGIETEIVEHHDRPAYAEMVRTKQIADGACFDSSPASTFRLLREKFYATSPGPWWLGYDNPRVDILIDKARRTVEVQPRKGFYQEAYELISQDAPWIFLYNPLRIIAVGKLNHKLELSPEGFVEFTAS